MSCQDPCVPTLQQSDSKWFTDETKVAINGTVLFLKVKLKSSIGLFSHSPAGLHTIVFLFCGTARHGICVSNLSMFFLLLSIADREWDHPHWVVKDFVFAMLNAHCQVAFSCSVAQEVMPVTLVLEATVICLGEDKMGKRMGSNGCHGWADKSKSLISFSVRQIQL